MANNSRTTARVRKVSIAQEKKSQRAPGGRATSRPSSRRKTGVPEPLKTGSAIPVQPEAERTKFTFHVNPTLTLVCLPVDTPTLFSLGAASNLTGVHPEMLRYYCRAGLVESIHGRSETELFFEESALHEVRRIEHYRRHLAVSRRALPLICKLRREAERKRIEIQFLRYP